MAPQTKAKTCYRHWRKNIPTCITVLLRTVPGTSAGKKLALTLGIKASKHDWLVFTEADCAPVSNQWLRRMARNFTSSTDIVLGI